MQEATNSNHTLAFDTSIRCSVLKLVSRGSFQTERMPYQVIRNAC